MTSFLFHFHRCFSFFEKKTNNVELHPASLFINLNPTRHFHYHESLKQMAMKYDPGLLNGRFILFIYYTLFDSCGDGPCVITATHNNRKSMDIGNFVTVAICGICSVPILFIQTKVLGRIEHSPRFCFSLNLTCAQRPHITDICKSFME